MRKALLALAIATVLTLMAVPASAQTYPPTPLPLRLSASVAVNGQQESLTGTGAPPHGQVFVYLSLGGHTIRVLGHVLPNGDGTFRLGFVVPNGLAPGRYLVTAKSGGHVIGTATLLVVAKGQHNGGLPFTGAEVLTGLWTGGGLIGAGGLLLFSIRRRRGRQAS